MTEWWSDEDRIEYDMKNSQYFDIPPMDTGSRSRKMRPSDPAYWMLFDGVESTPTVHRDGCYICEDDEYARMGLPLCFACFVCGAHVPADDMECENGHTQPSDPEEEAHLRKLYTTGTP